MFIEKLNENFISNMPIFVDEILELFCDYSRAQIFRFIKEAEKNNQLIKYCTGVYYIPEETPIGFSVISADSVAYKKYIKDEDFNGIYNGVKLLNTFSITTQMPAIIEIVSNNESSKCREVKIANRTFILRRPHCKITNDNVFAYTILQIFNDIDKQDTLSNYSKKKILRYAKENGVTKDQLFNLLNYFPSITSKNLIKSGLLNEIA